MYTNLHLSRPVFQGGEKPLTFGGAKAKSIAELVADTRYKPSSGVRLRVLTNHHISVQSELENALAATGKPVIHLDLFYEGGFRQAEFERFQEASKAKGNILTNKFEDALAAYQQLRTEAKAKGSPPPVIMVSSLERADQRLVYALLNMQSTGKYKASPDAEPISFDGGVDCYLTTALSFPSEQWPMSFEPFTDRVEILR